MLISANVRPLGLKKKGSNGAKELAEVMGCEADLRDMVGRLELSAESFDEIRFLRALYSVLGGVYNTSKGGSIEVCPADGPKIIYRNDGRLNRLKITEVKNAQPK